MHLYETVDLGAAIDRNGRTDHTIKSVDPNLHAFKLDPSAGSTINHAKIDGLNAAGDLVDCTLHPSRTGNHSLSASKSNTHTSSSKQNKTCVRSASKKKCLTSKRKELAANMLLCTKTTLHESSFHFENNI